MKNTIFLLLGLLVPGLSTMAQQVNWRAFDSVNTVVGVQIGMDINTAYGLSVANRLPMGIPAAAGIEYWAPFGNRFIDDWNLMATMQGELWRKGSWSATLKPSLGLRRVESPVAKIVSLNAGLSVSGGYLTNRWGALVEASVDQSLASHLQHGLLKETYPSVYDGWYKSMGGTARLGLLANVALGQNLLSVKLGRSWGQFFADSPTIPWYASVSLVRYF